jgi:hypothetical protein
LGAGRATAVICDGCHAFARRSVVVPHTMMALKSPAPCSAHDRS